MEHCVHDRVRVKPLLGHPQFSGELATIAGYSPEGYRLIRMEKGKAIEMLAQKEWFINLEHLKDSEVPKTPEERYVESSELSNFFNSSKQVSFNFSLPIETMEVDLYFEIDGKEYSVMITRTK